MSPRSLIGTAALAIVLPFAAHAGFMVEQPAPQAPAAAVAAEPTITDPGAFVPGFGDPQPLGIALSLVVPKNLTVQFMNPADRDLIVSWQGGRGWRLVLVDMLRGTGLTFEESPSGLLIKRAAQGYAAAPSAANTTAQLNTLQAQAAQMNTQVGPNGVSAQVGGVSAQVGAPMPVSSSVASSKAAEPERPTFDGKRVWIAQAGMTVREVLEKWSEEAGWNEPIWKVKARYTIQSTAGFSGSFTDAVREFSNAMANLDPPIEVHKFANKTLVVVPLGETP